MITRTAPFRFSLLLVVGSLVACEGEAPPLDTKALTEKAALRVEALMHESGQALAFTTAEGSTVKKVMGSTTSTADAVMSPAMAAAMPPTAMMRALAGPRLTQDMTGLQLPSMMTEEERFDETGQQLARLMRERLLVDSNLESNTNGTATYLLHADPVCRPLPQDTDPPGTVPALDAKCAEDFTKIDVRVAVTTDGDGVRMVVLVGGDRLELVQLIVHSDELAAELDLPKAKAAGDAIHQRLGDDSPIASYERLAGKLRASLKKVGSQKVTAAVAIRQALEVAQSGGSSVRIGASDPLFALTGDGVTKSAQIQVGLGTVDVAGTWDPRGTGVSNRDLHVTMGGLYGSLSLDEAAREIHFTDVGIGATRVAVRDAVILDLNLNADSMRRFSGKVTVDTNDVSRLELTPKFDLTLGFDYDSVAADYASPPAVEVAHETYGVTLANGGMPSILEQVRSTPTYGGGVKVIAGTLILKAASVPDQTVTVPAGRCLTSMTPAPMGSHPILGSLSVTDCP